VLHRQFPSDLRQELLRIALGVGQQAQPKPGQAGWTGGQSRRVALGTSDRTDSRIDDGFEHSCLLEVQSQGGARRMISNR
jgi:hypothetical protein